jgi:hypothetical protein
MLHRSPSLFSILKQSRFSSEEVAILHWMCDSGDATGGGAIDPSRFMLYSTVSLIQK